MSTENPEASDRTAYGLAQDEGHRALGRYVDAFSGMVRALSSNIQSAMHGHPTVCAMTLGIMTAGELERVHRGVVLMWRADVPLDREDDKALRDMEKQIADAVTKRNDYMHGEWLIGYGSSDKPGVPMDPMLLRWKPNTKAGPTAHETISVAELDAVSDRLIEVAGCLMHLRTWFGWPERHSLVDELALARGFAQDRLRRH